MSTEATAEQVLDTLELLHKQKTLAEAREDRALNALAMLVRVIERSGSAFYPKANPTTLDRAKKALTDAGRDWTKNEDEGGW